MAHAYDYLENIKFILTGSEVGLLEDFLHPKEAADPLSGREIRTQQIERFNPGTAERFLRAGFRETKTRIRSSEIELALKRFDGLVGWLVLYGSRVTEGETNPIDLTFADAKNTVLRDLKRVTSESEYYKYALNAIAEGKNEFEQIRLYIGLKINRNFNPGSMGRVIERLKKLSIIKVEGGKMSFEDPVTLAAAAEL
jgi:AAA+ ATPase superfamily predicted ATPase